jgi:hypothetical protein
MKRISEYEISGQRKCVMPRSVFAMYAWCKANTLLVLKTDAFRGNTDLDCFLC